MSNVIEAVSLLAAAVLGGMEMIYGIWAWKEQEKAFHSVWTEKLLYQSIGVWLILLWGIWFAAARVGTGFKGIFPQPGYLPAARFMALFLTYILLAAVDMKHKIIPDRILLCYFLSQILMGAASQSLAAMGRCLLEGSIFTVFLLVFACVSRGKLGMGDVKLLGVTAMTAGWMYTAQIAVYGLMISFVWGIWLLVFRKKSIKTEMAFVPFLLGGMMIQFIFLINT